MSLRQILEKLCVFGVKNPKSALALSFILFAIPTSFLPDIKTNFSSRLWHERDSIESLQLDQFEKDFGGDEIFILALDFPQGLYTRANLATIQNLSQQLERLPDVLNVSSLANTDIIFSEQDDLSISPLIDTTIPLSLTEIQSKADATREIQNVLIDKEKSLAVFKIQLRPSFGKNPNYTPFTQALRNLIDTKYRALKTRFHYLGPVAVANSFKEISGKDTAIHLPIMFGLIFILLWFYFRTMAGVLVPLLVMISTTIASFGFMAAVGIEFNSILTAIPGVLLGICVADTVHILTTFYQMRDKKHELEESLIRSLQKNLVPTLLTTLTTSVSFLSISFTELVPIKGLALTSFFGTALAWPMSYLLIPSLIILLPNKFSQAKQKNQKRFRVSNLDWMWKYQKPIKYLFIFLSLICTIACFFNKTNSDPLKYFAETTPIIKDFNHIQAKMGTIRSHNLVVDAPKTIKDPVFLKNLDNYLSALNQLPYVSKTTSILDILKKIHQVTHGDNPDFYQVPPSRSHIADYLLLYQMGAQGNSGISGLVNSSETKTKLTLYWEVENSQDSFEKNREIEKLAKKYDLNAKAAGTFTMYSGVNKKVLTTFYSSIVIAIVMVSLILFIVFKNLKLALIAMLPNLLPLIFVGSLTALLGISIDVGASIVFTICLGIAVDDTIHFLGQYNQAIKNGLDHQDAILETFQGAGEAIILTTMVLVAGFGSFVLADFMPNRNFGVLASSVLLFAVLTDLVFLPVLLGRKNP